MARGKQQKSNKPVSLPLVPSMDQSKRGTTSAIIEDPEAGVLKYATRISTAAPLEAMYDRNQIGLAQLQAGQKYKSFWDAANIGKNIGIDTTKERVDTSRRPTDHHPETVDAIREMGKAQRRLGILSSSICDHVIIIGLSIHKYAAMIHGQQPIDTAVREYRAVFQVALWELADHWNITVPTKRRRKSQAYMKDFTEEELAEIPEQPDSAVYHSDKTRTKK